MTLLQRSIKDAISTFEGIKSLEVPLQRAVDLVVRSLTNGHKLLTCGNGGSGADAAHLAAEFLCRYRDDRRPYAAIALTVDGPFMTAVGNDYAFEEVFARQVRGLGQPGDVLIVLTTSGKSRNVVRALEEAEACGLESIAFLGRDGGFTKGLATVDLLVPGTATARIQEAHKLLLHALCEMAEEKLAK